MGKKKIQIFHGPQMMMPTDFGPLTCPLAILLLSVIS